MKAQTSAAILIMLSVALGATIGILGALDPDSVGLVAAIGGAILGILWVARGLLNRSPGRD